ncbi:hypothetical protein BU26DRAFT_523474 [Trematosphaeria pertusa]|uniref:Glyoxalase-like domain-containing protein n=1 Tax=Trematosphaeria pertusa TaxID=390896 RepID=A0A6A6I0X6_9PLEO|nr:uncharacterized protein BU26DRAFT_523474 [Trematosphaeria pertusa]KAF2243926.1 hypothetical protein BU26DRAFT_523474 [Trematosphaeria pertusa]
MSTPTPSLDHLILFLPAGPNNLPLIPPFLSSNFTLTPGGTHADGLTSNTLILLADGCYIELICFLPSAALSKLQTHWWGPNPARKGWTDWCLTTAAPDSAEANHERVQATHAAPLQGARRRADGVDVKWAVTFPAGANGGQEVRGKLPFFCHDITPRELRVPLSASNTTHLCGARGVREISVVLPSRETLEETRALYASLFDERPGAEGDEEFSFSVGRVKSVEGLEEGAGIVLRLPRNEEEREKVRERGVCVCDVVLAARAGEGRERGKRWRLDGEGEDDVGGLWVEYV